MKKFKLLLLTLLFTDFIFAGKIIPLQDHLKPNLISVDQNQIIISEFPSIYIYSLKDFSLIKKFGSAGEGPQEFFAFAEVQDFPDKPEYIIVASHLKVSFYTRQGEFVKEVRGKTGFTGDVFKPLAEDKYAAYKWRWENDTLYSTVNLYDSNLKLVKEISKWERPIQEGTTKPVELPDVDLIGGEFRIYDKKIFVLKRKEGIIESFDDIGNLLYTTKYEYEPIPFTDEDEKKFFNFFETDPRYRQGFQQLKKLVKIPKYFPPVRVLNAADDKLYVLTNKRVPGKSEFVIFDLKGKLLKKVMVPFINANPMEVFPFTIKDGNIFQLVEIEKGDDQVWELHINKIE